MNLYNKIKKPALAASLFLFSTGCGPDYEESLLNDQQQDDPEIIIPTEKLPLPQDKVPEIVKVYNPVDLAKCLVSDYVDAVMFGAEWCAPCHYQEDLFGPEAWQIIENAGNHITCSYTDNIEQTEECNLEGILFYPTWKAKTIPDQVIGWQNLEEFAEFTPCKYIPPQREYESTWQKSEEFTPSRFIPIYRGKE